MCESSECEICGIKFAEWRDVDGDLMSHTCKDCALSEAEGMYLYSLHALEDSHEKNS